ncbi:DNA excision repair protein ERCC-6-like [Argopecten irradians]|uniref:DNA excision repair protein ERCC-6-like n=1 Tax=Argopecten irradians TaxID=31199 RepID=UPI0037116277
METALKDACNTLNSIKLKDEPDFKNSLSSRAIEDADTKENVKPRHMSEEELTHDEQVKFNRLVTKASQLAADGQVRMALEMNKRALKIHHKDKLVRRIQKMEAYLEQYGDEEESEEEDDNGMVLVGNEFYLYKDLYNKLYDHQKAGVLWFWSLHKKRKGGILGDDMGLGKTIQMIAFLSGLFDMDKVHAVLIVMPVSLISNWEKEFKKWAPGIRVTLFHGSSKREKERALAKVQRRGGVCLTSYGLVVTSFEQLGQKEGREFQWDYMILDEGHKIKNPTKTTKGVHAIGAKNRIVLTGTPVQNNLKELWALFDFVHKGTLLGTARTFKMEYDTPITRARERDATAGERKLGMMMADSLKKIIAPYFLRRTKAEVAKKEKTLDDKSSEDESGQERKQIKMPTMTRKNDFIVWLFLTRTQQQIYQDFLSLDSVKELLMTKKSPLVALTVLKKITDHPRLLSKRACAQLGLDGEEAMDSSLLESEEGLSSAATEIHNIDDEILINESGKLIFIVQLLTQLKAEGHRTLIFSQSRKILDIIEKVTTNRGHKIMRLDGTVTHICERDQRIQKFQTDTSYNLFLLTTQVGGVGLTLTAADRVIIFDPSWNPATDAQAVDRVFRIGQDKNVVIYRLITCGTVEEKIYRRQVFKDSITRQTTGNAKNPYRYFTKQELKELFILDNPRHSKTQVQLQEMHHGSRISDTSLDTHIAFLHSLDLFGLSDHDLMFNKASESMDDQLEDQEEPPSKSHLRGNDYIEHRVQKAQQLLQMESELGEGSTLEERFSKYPRAAPIQRELPQFNFGPSERQFYPLPGDEEPERKYKAEPVDLTTVESPDKSIHSTGESDDPIVLDESTDDLEVKDIEEKLGDMSIQITEPPEENHDIVEIDSDSEGISIEKSQKSDDKECTEDPENPEDDPIAVKMEVDTDVKREPVMFDDSQENSPVTMAMTTPKRRNDKRKSVSHSPWLSRTPKSSKYSPVVNEEIFISPDASRPIVKVEPKPLSSLFRTESNTPKVRKHSSLNTTIFSALSTDSPDVQNNSPSSSEHEASPQSSDGGGAGRDNLYMTFVGDSPDSHTAKIPRACMTMVVNSSDEEEGEITGQTPDVSNTIENSPYVGRDEVVGDSDEDESPCKPRNESDSICDDGNAVVNSPLLDKEEVVDDLGDEEADKSDDESSLENSPFVSKKGPIVKSDDEEDDESSLENSPFVSKKGPIVESDEEEGDESSLDNSPLVSKKGPVVESDDENSPVRGRGVSHKTASPQSLEEEHSDEDDINFESKKPRKRIKALESDDESDEEGENSEDDEKNSFINDEDDDESGDESRDESDYSEEAETSEEEERKDSKRKSALDSLSEDMKVMYKELVQSGRSLLKSGQYEEAMANVLQAIEICPEPSTQALALTIHKAMEA